ncbi:MAG: competence/damage-inducible protein A [Rhodospirillaceae bacterium]|jgi:molybdenum cofactor synthesis domain-containing protein
MPSEPKAALIVIGNEILSGRTQDANIQFLATSLGKLGIPLCEVRVIPDIEDEIVDAVNTLRSIHSYVFTTGGIGPTHDDITAAAVAKAFGVPLERHQPSVEKMKKFYSARLNEARLKMADLPKGAEPIETRATSAPGIQIENVFVLAGVPSIARAMFDSVAPSLTRGAPVLSRFVEAHLGEGDIADALTTIQNEHPHVDLGSYPFFRGKRIGLSVVAKGTDKSDIDTVIDKVAAAIRDLGHDPSVDVQLDN